MTAGKMNVKEKIKDIHFYRAVSDISRPIADSTHTISQIGFYIVELIMNRRRASWSWPVPGPRQPSANTAWA